MTLLTALPITLALCGNADALGVSDAAKARKEFCKHLATIKDPKDPQYVLKQFCDSTTFHCTTHRKAGLFGQVKGVCDDPNLCKNPVIREACESQCLNARSGGFGIEDAKSKKIEEKLTTCSVQPGMLDKAKQPTQETTSTSPSKRGSLTQSQPSVVPPQMPVMEEPTVYHAQPSRRGSMIQPQPSIVPPPVPVMEEPTVDHVQPSRRDSMVGPRRGSMIQPQAPSMTAPGTLMPPPPPMAMPEDTIPTPPSMTLPGAVPPPPPLPPAGYKPKASIVAPNIKPQQEQLKPQAPIMSQPIDLLDQIREGKPLKKSSDRILAEPKQQEEDMFSSLKKNMDSRYAAIHGDNENDDEDEDDNWE